VSWEKGDRVLIHVGPHRMPGEVILASGNSRSLMLQFEGVLEGHVGMMPVLLERDGIYRSILSGHEVAVTWLLPGADA
jgi:hypothetical protein